MIDKDQERPLEWMIRNTYTSVITRTIVHMVLFDIGDILNSVNKKTSKPSLVIKVLRDPRITKSLIARLDEVHAKRCEGVIDEILKQYGLVLGADEVEFYHRHMGEVYVRQIEMIKGLILRGDYNTLYGLRREVAH